MTAYGYNPDAGIDWDSQRHQDAVRLAEALEEIARAIAKSKPSSSLGSLDLLAFLAFLWIIFHITPVLAFLDRLLAS